MEALDLGLKDIFLRLENISDSLLHDTSYGWSLIQVLSHLETSEAGTIIYMKKKMQAGADKIPAFGWSNRLRLWMTIGLLRTSLKWKAPKYVAKPAGHFSLNEIRQKWNKTREGTREYVAEYPAELLPKAIFKHPMAGRIDIMGAIDSMIFHQEHHIHQIDRIKKKVGI